MGVGLPKQQLCTKPVLSYDLMKQHLIFLAENDLIEYEQGMMTYRTTEKGMRLLQLYNNMNEMAQLTVMAKRTE